ncbi:efflux RND transporter periplasmic adaptor subunit [Baaleninema sp.]|uniref:efflux RND transporter periplasmic adaptor subunit n=1 Tax=Baaleninema sp. TaxID=3101197 RepID=UPI003D06A91E
MIRLQKAGAIALLVSSLYLVMGCAADREETAQAQPQRSRGDRTVTVDVAVAEAQQQTDELTYSGTTQPARGVSLRARSDGQLLDLTVEEGDPVFQGQVLAQIEDALLLSELAAAEAEVGARQAEVEVYRSQSSEARVRVEEIRAELEQARADARRFSRLAAEGAIPQQDAEIARTTVRTLEQQLLAAEEQVRIRDRTIDAAQQRVNAQQALVNGIEQRLAYTEVLAPFGGIVLDRLLEPGDIVQTGDAILELGDFSEIEVRIEIPDRDRERISLGQSVEVKLDAFPSRSFSGRVSQIFPIADPVARLIPVKIVLSSAELGNEPIGSGLLARVTLNAPPKSTVWIPDSALDVSAEGENTLFIIGDRQPETAVRARSVQIGDRKDGKVEILEGLVPGDRFVVRSDRPLRDEQTVRPSFLSEE